MDKSPLARLPPELRSSVYALALRQVNPITVRVNRHARLCFTESFAHDARATLAIIATCREVREESMSMLFAANDWVLDFTDTDFGTFQYTAVLDKFVARTVVRLHPASFGSLTVNLGTLNYLGFHEFQHAAIQMMAWKGGLKVPLYLRVSLACSGIYHFHLDFRNLASECGQKIEVLKARMAFMASGIDRVQLGWAIKELERVKATGVSKRSRGSQLPLFVSTEGLNEKERSLPFRSLSGQE